MAQVDLVAELEKDNPGVTRMLLEVFASSLRLYCEAAENIRRNGGIVAHPRTGAPLENPYLKVLERHGKLLREQRRIQADRVMALLEMELAPRV